MEIIRPGTNIDFIGKQGQFAILSIVLVLISLVLLTTPGPNYGIDFKGGTNIIVHFNESIQSGDITATMVEMGFDDAVVQIFGTDDENQFLIQTNFISSIDQTQAEQIRTTVEGEYGELQTFSYDQDSGDRIEVRFPEGALDGIVPEAPLELDPEAEPDTEEAAVDTETASDEYVPSAFAIRTARESAIQSLLESSGLNNPQVSEIGNPRHNRFLIRLQQLQTAVQNGLSGAFGESFNRVDRVETVGPRVGQQLRDDGVKAVILALFFILIYIGMRFNMNYAPGAVVALFHDVLITLGIFVVLQEEITLTILAALLTIVGYSLNDTIVVFDRIRENIGVLRTKDLTTVVNQSINECLSRTLLTSITTLIAVLSIFFLGGGLIKSFALAMIIGIIVGTYSSVYVASPVMLLINNWAESRKKG